MDESFLADAMRLFQDVVEKSVSAESRIHIQRVEHEPPGIYMIVNADGTFQRVKAERGVLVDSTPSLMEFIKLVLARAEESAKPEVWYSQNHVVFLPDGDARTNRTSLDLPVHPRFEELPFKTLTITQPGLVKWLRVRMAEFSTVSSEKLMMFSRNMKREGSTHHAAEIKTGRTSMNKSLAVEFSQPDGNGGKIGCPEEFTLNMPYYQDAGIAKRYGVKIGVDMAVDADVAFELDCIADRSSLEQAAVNDLGEILRAHLKDVAQVYAGKPAYNVI